MRQYVGVSVPDDQIYERYQARAIAETNQLGHEIATWVGDHHPAQAPVIGTGHPRADIFLLKYRPMAAEVQEGVAFFGRAGQAVLKSIERLRIDPLKLYGSVCLKVDIDPEPEGLAHPRAAHHPARHRGHDGRGRRRLPGIAGVPAVVAGRVQLRRGAAVHPHDRPACRTGHRQLAERLRRQARVLGGVQGAGRVVRQPAAVLTLRVAGALALAPAAGVGARLLLWAVPAVLATALLIWAGYSGTPATLAKLVAASLIGLGLGSLLQTPVEIVGIAVLI